MRLLVTFVFETNVGVICPIVWCPCLPSSSATSCLSSTNLHLNYDSKNGAGLWPHHFAIIDSVLHWTAQDLNRAFVNAVVVHTPVRFCWCEIYSLIYLCVKNTWRHFETCGEWRYQCVMEHPYELLTVFRTRHNLSVNVTLAVKKAKVTCIVFNNQFLAIVVVQRIISQQKLSLEVCQSFTL